MISKKLLKEYDFDSIYDYFNMVIESKINGNHKQTIEQFNRIEKLRRFDFIIHVQNVKPDLYEYFLNLVTGN